MLYVRVAAGVVIGMASSSLAAAQEARVFDIGMRAEVEHNTNVARSSKELANVRGIDPADTIFTPSATVNIILPVGRQSVFLRGAAGYSFYNKNDRLDRERIDLSGGVNGRFGLCSGQLGGGYRRGISTVDDPTLVGDVENIQEVNTISLGVSCAAPSGFGLVANASKEWTYNSLGFLEVSDAETTSGMIGVSYARPTLGTLTLFGSRDETRYPNRLLNKSYDVNSLGLTYERKLGARIEGSATVALSRIDSGDGPGGGSSDITAYAVDLAYRATDRLRLSASFDRSITPSTGVIGTYDLTQSYQVLATYGVGSRISVTAGASHSERDSGGVIFGIPLQIDASETSTVFGSVRYQHSRKLALVASLGREKRTANLPQFDYTNDRIGVSAEYLF